MIRQFIANGPLDAGQPDRPVDWAELGRRIRAAAERAVAKPSADELAVDVRRLLLEGVASPSAQRSRLIRDLVGEPAPGSHLAGDSEAAQ